MNYLNYRVRWVVLATIGVLNLSTPLGAQELLWERHYRQPDYDSVTLGQWYGGQTVTETSTGGLLVTAITGGGFSCAYLKTDSKGELRWVKTFGDARKVPVYLVLAYETARGEFTFEGLKAPDPRYDGGWLYLYTVDSSGAFLREHLSDIPSGEPALYHIADRGTRSVNGSFVFAEPYNTTIALGGVDATSWKLTWWHSLDTFANTQSVTVVRPTLDSGYIILGDSTFFGTSTTPFIIKTDSLGKKLWKRTLGPYIARYPEDVCQTADGGFIVLCYAATKRGNIAFRHSVLTKIDPAGNVLWDKELDRDTMTIGQSVLQTRDGGFVIAGYRAGLNAGGSSILQGSQRAYVMKTDGNGMFQWDKVLVADSMSELQGVTQTKDGNYVVTGFIGMKDTTDLYLAKISNDPAEVRTGESSASPMNLFIIPNPVQTTATITYNLTVASHVRITIWDALGNTVRIVTDERQEPGIHTVGFNGQRLPAGAYFCRIESGGKVLSQAMTKVER